jgi:hypothetical protein
MLLCLLCPRVGGLWKQNVPLKRLHRPTTRTLYCQARRKAVPLNRTAVEAISLRKFS